MSPKRAIIIILILAMIVAAGFSVALYFKKQVANQPAKQFSGNGITASSTDQEKLTPEQQKIKAIETKTREQVGQIVEQGKTASGGITAEAQRKVEDAVNREIMEKLKLKTPEELKADEQRQAELEKLQQEINEQIKSQLKK